MTRSLRALVGGGLVAVIAAAPSTAAAQPATWNFQQADVPAAQPLGDYGKGVLVAVVDTWVDPTQPEFGGRVVDEADCLPGSCRDHTYAPDSCVHGTHVAGTIASADYGVAPQADVLAVQVLSGPTGSPDPSASCSGSTSTVAAGIDFAVSKGARVINLSVGDEVPGLFQSSAISAAVTSAAQHGVVVVFAAGNQGVPLTDSYGNDALLVAATGPSGQLASYSNFNTALTGAVNVAAPGGDSGQGSCTVSACVLSTYPDKQLGLMEGTSMAAPHVSGLAALLLAQDPSRGVSGVFSAIEKTAKPLAGAGSGLIDAAQALRTEGADNPPIHTPTATTLSVTESTKTTSGPLVRTYSPLWAASSAAQVPALSGETPASTRTPPNEPELTTLPSYPTSVTPETASQTPMAAPPLGRTGNRSGWPGEHVGILLLASALVFADGLALFRTRGARRIPHRMPTQHPRSDL